VVAEAAHCILEMDLLVVLVEKVAVAVDQITVLLMVQVVLDLIKDILQELTLAELQNLTVVELVDLPLAVAEAVEDPPEALADNHNKLDQEIMTHQRHGLLVEEMGDQVFVSLDMN